MAEVMAAAGRITRSPASAAGHVLHMQGAAVRQVVPLRVAVVAP
jgi:hypothetical protein